MHILHILLATLLGPVAHGVYVPQFRVSWKPLYFSSTLGTKADVSPNSALTHSGREGYRLLVHTNQTVILHSSPDQHISGGCTFETVVSSCENLIVEVLVVNNGMVHVAPHPQNEACRLTTELIGFQEYENFYVSFYNTGLDTVMVKLCSIECNAFKLTGSPNVSSIFIESVEYLMSALSYPFNSLAIINVLYLIFTLWAIKKLIS